MTTFLEAVIDDLQAKVTTPITELDIFSDGAAQHFKSKFMFVWTSSLRVRRGICANWHYSATSHGKDAVDGVGGTIKRSVFRSIKARTHHINNAEQYAACAQQVLTNITIIHISSAAITAKKPELDAIWQSVVTVPGTHGVHGVRTREYGHVTVASSSDQPGVEYCLLPPPTESAVNPAPATDSTTDAAMTVIPGRWYGVYWSPTQYWYIGRAVGQHESEANTWYFPSLSRPNPRLMLSSMLKTLNQLVVTMCLLK